MKITAKRRTRKNGKSTALSGTRSTHPTSPTSREEPDKDSRDDDTQVDRSICAWNNSVTEAINWVEPNKVAIRASLLDITTIDKNGAPMELQEVIDEPLIGCSTDIENK